MYPPSGNDQRTNDTTQTLRPNPFPPEPTTVHRVGTHSPGVTIPAHAVITPSTVTDTVSYIVPVSDSIRYSIPNTQRTEVISHIPHEYTGRTQVITSSSAYTPVIVEPSDQVPSDYTVYTTVSATTYKSRPSFSTSPSSLASEDAPAIVPQTATQQTVHYTDSAPSASSVILASKEVLPVLLTYD